MFSSIKFVYSWSISDVSVTEFLQKIIFFFPYVVMQGTFDGPERVENSVPQGH